MGTRPLSGVDLRVYRLGVLTALPDEARSFTGYRVPTVTVVAPRSDVLLYVSGIGAERAAAGAVALVHAGATALLSWGCAGGLNLDLPPGAVVMPTAVVDRTGRHWVTDKPWRAACSAVVPASLWVASATTLAEAEQVLASCADKRRLAVATGADVVDMESAAVAQVAADYSLPFLTLRAVVDAADFALPGCLYGALDAFGAPRVLALASRVMQQPGDMLRLVRLARHYRTALASLRALCGYFPNGVGSSTPFEYKDK